MGCVLRIIEIKQKQKYNKQKQNDNNDRFKYCPPKKKEINASNHYLNISNLSRIDLVEFLSLNNTFIDGVNDEEIMFDGEEIDILKELENELKIENKSTVNLISTHYC